MFATGFTVVCVFISSTGGVGESFDSKLVFSFGLSFATDVIGFGVEGADGVDVPEVDATADVLADCVIEISFGPLPPLRP